MHHPTDRTTHTTAFVTPVVDHWLEREIAQWVHPMNDRSNDPSHHERMLLPQSYISLLPQSYISFPKSLRACCRYTQRTCKVHYFDCVVNLFQVFGRHIATTRLASGAYMTEFGDDSEIKTVAEKVQVCVSLKISWYHLTFDRQV